MRKLIIIIAAVSISFSTPTNIGIVKFYNEDAGIGYIVDGQDQIIVYDCGLIDEVAKGDIVTFDTKDSKKGLEAYNVRLKK